MTQTKTTFTLTATIPGDRCFDPRTAFVAEFSAEGNARAAAGRMTDAGYTVSVTRPSGATLLNWGSEDAQALLRELLRRNVPVAQQGAAILAIADERYPVIAATIRAHNPAKTLPPPTNDVARCEACSGTGFTVNSGGGKEPCQCTGEFA
jgi:2-polyprenyl-6-methoxyphenol hydroxylase-like FAD-dependent oxidoreductase